MTQADPIRTETPDDDDLRQRLAHQGLSVDDLGLPPNLKVVDIIGMGGMGAVFKVQDQTGKIQAVKILLPQEAQNKKRVMRFLQEAQHATSLSNPHIVAVHECDSTNAGLPYMLMEYVEGITLADLLDERTAGVDESVDIAMQIAEGLAHAHKKGILHRDMKPANVMLLKDEKGNRLVKVLDFGIAKMMMDVDGQPLHQLTTGGEVMGTPTYMSPEQALGQQLDARSDIYSLGCIMYSLLTGAPPYTGSTLLDILLQHAQTPIPEITKVRNDVPKRLALVIDKTLEKRPEDRYESMDALITDLARVRQGGPSTVWLTGKQRHQVRQVSKFVSIILFSFLVMAAVTWGVEFLSHARH